MVIKAVLKPRRVSDPFFCR
ncbi:hypothetical protein PIIN_11099 [Serendipita indica DSM 11827]|uniref:Uncharacterized protein n=1 Tax=Serendipita indica (strain DSM 11827) TaxID=1109443 RepID=G4U0M3_SERID|nr:hypothetical protein PIIN_11099 [Serendipita indica DSM 11827]